MEEVVWREEVNLAGIGPIVQFDWTMNVGHVITILGFLTGGILWFQTLKSGQDVLSRKVSDLEEDVRDLKLILNTLGKHDEKFVNIASNMTRMQKEIDDLRRGEGFIMPLSSGARRG